VLHLEKYFSSGKKIVPFGKKIPHERKEKLKKNYVSIKNALL